MAFFQAHAGGLDVSVRATPKGGRDALDGIVTLSDGREVLKIRVRAAPEDGAATEAVARVLAKAAGVSASRVALVSGATARLKVFRITGDAELLQAVLERAIAKT
ncbi:MAG: hypothetical protein B7Y12_15580 [Rhizobiales bacterium 24-66-13]|uniref:DUF167 family protein n=1 Tax=Roseixanthobacter finlandensis TaxID=3119922 RepID=UPI000BCAF60B|nr:MAG: hypothetical protein B7Y61_23105 [Rhizobiales bacterium 35-66-30]OYZ72522.1 MAG: hypothetical protein B7Y12_15580 [Rhizobiales bacterium 24-66-13]OZB03005.1 MAG: hypothetical protein B7X67_18355 [Rhizobiales bacterium 39-66-18]HQS08089.1 DUF167 family protein [Xanthobacteraceae bacterium]HQS46137.1 DUF167 family protein [Xanthobacteraceae bacterium]